MCLFIMLNSLLIWVLTEKHIQKCGPFSPPFIKDAMAVTGISRLDFS